MNKEIYESLEIEVITFESADIVTASEPDITTTKFETPIL